MVAKTEKVKSHTRREGGKVVTVKGYTRKGDSPLPKAKPLAEALGTPDRDERKQKELQMWWKWKLGGERPEDMRPLVRSFMGLVHKQANVYVGNVQIPPEAIRAEFVKQLISGLKGYDPKRGTAISTYVTWHLKKAQRYIATYQNTARIPEERIWKIREFEMARQKLIDELHRDPTDDELAEELGWETKAVVLLDTELRQDLTTSKFESDPTSVMPPMELEVLKLFLYELKDEEQEVYRHLIGLGRPKVTEILPLAEKLGEPPHKVYRIRAGIVKKLKAYMEEAGL